jgi:hypothetical protein
VMRRKKSIAPAVIEKILYDNRVACTDFDDHRTSSYPESVREYQDSRVDADFGSTTAIVALSMNKTVPGFLRQPGQGRKTVIARSICRQTNPEQWVERL